MNKELLKSLKTLFPEFDFSLTGSESIFATKNVESKEIKDSNKNTIRISGLRHIFVSSLFPPKENNPEFRYVIVATNSKKRNYRCKYFYDYEFDKRFYSAHSDKELIEVLSKAKENNEI